MKWIVRWLYGSRSWQLVGGIVRNDVISLCRRHSISHRYRCSARSGNAGTRRPRSGGLLDETGGVNLRQSTCSLCPDWRFFLRKGSIRGIEATKGGSCGYRGTVIGRSRFSRVANPTY